MAQSNSKKLPYRPPKLEEYGTISQLTQSSKGMMTDNKGKDKNMSVGPMG